MPITSKIDSPNNLIFNTLSGEITYKDLILSLELYWQAPDPISNLLLEFQDATFNIITSEVEKTAIFLKKYMHRFKRGKTAIVVSENIGSDLSRITQTDDELKKIPIMFQVFSTTNEAMEWLTAK